MSALFESRRECACTPNEVSRDAGIPEPFDSLLLCAAMRRVLLFMLDRLGSPKSSSSSSSYSFKSASKSSTVQSSFVFERKLWYERPGGGAREEDCFAGGGVASLWRILPEDVDGGVFGRPEEDERLLFLLSKDLRTNLHYGIRHTGSQI